MILLTTKTKKKMRNYRIFTQFCGEATVEAKFITIAENGYILFHNKDSEIIAIAPVGSLVL